MTNPTAKEKADVKSIILDMCLETRYGLDLFESHKQELQEQAKELTKYINSTKKKLKLLEEKYKLINGKDIKYTNR